jgi:hypothetical protein
MKNSSRIAKGRYLQNIVKDKIVKLYPVLTNADVRTCMVAEHGADVKLITPIARKLFNYSIECKNRQEFKNLYSYFEQAIGHSNMEPLLVIKMNRKRPLAIVDLDHLFKLQMDQDN